MTTSTILTLVFSALTLVFSGLAIYFNVKARRLRRARYEEQYRRIQRLGDEAVEAARRAAYEARRRRGEEKAILFAQRYCTPLPRTIRVPESERLNDLPPLDPAAFGAFVGALHDETVVKMAQSDPGPAAWVGHGGDFSGGGASGSFDSSPDVSSPSSSDSGSCDSGGSSDSSSGSCGVD